MSQNVMEGILTLRDLSKVTEEIDFHNSSEFTSETSDLFPATDTNTGPDKKQPTTL